ncbi:MAG TPA: dephospho-CoA kinase [Ruminococcaceae bacterium]|nr:dephospho-CoA kinase [Oscillospiraceae bacterium]
MKPIVLGLTGPTGAGKTLAAGYLKDVFFHIDCDRIARETVQPGTVGLVRLREAFGAGILRPDGSLDRKALAALAFARRESTALLNSLVHPLITERVKSLLAECKAAKKPALLDAPLLFESGAGSLCDFTAAVLAGKETRILRIMARDKIDRAQALLRTQAQQNDEYYRSRADFIIYNDENPSRLEAQLDAITNTLIQSRRGGF